MILDARLDRNAKFVRAMNRAPEIFIEALRDGLTEATTEAAKDAEKLLNSGELGRQSRTGQLARSIKSYPDPSGDPLVRYIGTGGDESVKHYAWQLGRKQKVISAKKGWMSIPAGDNQRGVLFSSPKNVTGGFFIPKGDHLLFGTASGGKFRLLFTLVKTVKIKGAWFLSKATTGLNKMKMAVSVRKFLHRRLREVGLK